MQNCQETKYIPKAHEPIAINTSTNFNLGKYCDGLYRLSHCISWKYNYFGVITFRKLHTLVCYLPFFLHVNWPSFSPTYFANSIGIQEHHFRSGYNIFEQILENNISIKWHEASNELSLQSSNRWSN